MQAIKAKSEAEKKKQEKKAALARPTRANSFPSMSPGHKQPDLQTRGPAHTPPADAATAATLTAIAAPAVDQSQHILSPHATALAEAQPGQQNSNVAAGSPDAVQAQEHPSQQQDRDPGHGHAQGSGPSMPGAAAQHHSQRAQHGVPQPASVQHTSTGAAAVQQQLQVSQHGSAVGGKAQQVAEVKQGSCNDSAVDQHSAAQLPGRQAPQQGAVWEGAIKAAATGS